jgi:DNA-directed RNA polymerase specialized sigma24 family protein
MNNVLEKIRKYKELKADIGDIDIRIKEIEDEVLGPGAIGYEERTGETYKITSSTEQQAEKLMQRKGELIMQRKMKERDIERIDNAITVLKDEEKEVIELVHKERKEYWKVQEKLHKSYPRIKQIEADAVRKMKKYLP